MAFGNNSTSADALLKEFYSDKEVERALFKDHVLFGLLPKQEDVSGRHYVEAIVVGTGQGRSATFATAQSQAALSGETVLDFMIPLVENHEVANIASKLISQAPNKGPGAFLKAVSLIADNQLQNLGNDISISIYRGADGSRGTIGSATTIAGSVLTFANASDALNFEIGMQLDLAAAVTGGVRAYGSANHGLYVIAVDYSKGTLTVGTTPVAGGTACNISDTTNGIPTAAVGDFVFAAGDYGLRFSGLSDWLPATVASNDSFMGVNRSSNRVRLAGTFYDARNGQSLCSALENGMALVAQQGGTTSHWLMSHPKMSQLSQELGAKAQLVDVKSTNAQVGYTGIRIAGAKGVAICLADPHCPSDRMYGLDIDTWSLVSQGKMARVWQEDGLVWLRSATAAGMEIRFYSFGALACSNPRSNIAVQTTAS